MITSKASPFCHSTFQSKLFVLSSSRNENATFSSRQRFNCRMKTMVYASATGQDSHTTLGVARGACKHEVKKAYRRLALQYHPDVCKGNDCTTNFKRINLAYETILSMGTPQFEKFEDDSSDNSEGFMGVGDDSWEDCEEWMSWEGAGTLDYSGHINCST